MRASLPLASALLAGALVVTSCGSGHQLSSAQEATRIDAVCDAIYTMLDAVQSDSNRNEHDGLDQAQSRVDALMKKQPGSKNGKTLQAFLRAWSHGGFATIKQSLVTETVAICPRYGSSNSSGS